MLRIQCKRPELNKNLCSQSGYLVSYGYHHRMLILLQYWVNTVTVDNIVNIVTIVTILLQY